MGLKKKIKLLIREDHPAKLKSLLYSQDADPSSTLFSGGRNALHYCAEFGSVDMMRCLLRLECDPMHRDRDGRLPLHTALYRSLDEDLNTAIEIHDGIVSLLLNISPMSQDVEDRNHATCYDLLKKLKTRFNAGIRKGQTAGETSGREEMEWHKKLATESQFEFEELEPHHNYIADYSDKEEQESFSAWSNRLCQEYRNKKHNPDTRNQSSRPRKRHGISTAHEKAKKSKNQPDPEEDLRKAREEMRKNFKPPPVENIAQEQLLSKKLRYEKRFNYFFNHPPAPCSVTFGSIPWPCTNVDKLTETLFCDFPDKNSSDYRKFLRKERVRWHPDKFFQKFRDFLHAEHVDKIMTRVKMISQILNSLAA